MEKYLGVKLIDGEPMTECAFLRTIKGQNTSNREDRPGYKVVYPDGYVSWSPKAVFEEAYRRIDNLTFGLAIEAAKKGHKIARKGWNGKGMWLAYISHWDMPTVHAMELFPCGCDAGTFLPFIGMKTADNKFVPWLASQTDVLAEDWVIIE